MSQVSRRKLNDKVYARIFEIFVASLASANSPCKVEILIGDLLTRTEKIVLAKRLSIALLLLKKYSYDSIESILKVSRPTVWQVKRLMEEGKGGYKAILEEFMKQENERNIISGFFNLLEDIFPPAMGTNWKLARQKQWVERRRKEKPF